MTLARQRIALATLFAGAFVMGCAEMLVVGLIDLIAEDLRVSLAAAGGLVTANALGLAIGGPLLTFLTTRMDRRRVLLGSVIVFALANLLPAFGADYPVFLVARILIGSVQGLFIAAAMVTATTIVPPQRSGRAMALVISGFATASAVGLPLGTLLGQAVGWRGSFIAVVAAAVIVLAAAIAALPPVPSDAGARAIGQARAAFAPRVLALLGLCVLIFAAMLSAITYLVPYLGEVAGITGAGVTPYLLAYGVATAFGSYAGGRFADRSASSALIVGSIGVTVALVALLVLGGSPVLAAIAVVGIGAFGMGMAPSLQHRVVTLAGPGAPLAASLPASAVNAGIALGGFVGGLSLEAAGVRTVALTGIAIAVLAVGAAWATSRLKPASTDAHLTTTATGTIHREEASS